MAELLRASEVQETIIFKGRPKSMVSAMALLIAGILTFTLGINQLFFVEAMAWTFLIWGALLLYGHIIDLGTVYEITDNGLEIRSPLRFWAISRKWNWSHFTRLDLIVERLEAEEADVVMQVHYTPEGSTVLHREDVLYNAKLAAEIVNRAGLKPETRQTMQDFTAIPQEETGTYTWK